MLAPEKLLLVYDFAEGGDTVSDMEETVEGPYKELIKTKARPGEHWNPGTSLFVFWIGTNNIGDTFSEDDASGFMSDIFKCVQTVYDTGARAFLFIDVPPVERGPLIVIYPNISQRFASICSMWNRLFRCRIDAFSEEHPDASCFQFSSHKCLNNILDNPTKHSFLQEDVTKYGGEIWVDHIHLTSSVHKILATDVLEYLRTV
ncbi:hypothetical protein FRC12_020483 [Ceratobasidium sp. 428]|nr:hypothetical protein FRC12_020483 [Ceratobasidium sp. 428]